MNSPLTSANDWRTTAVLIALTAALALCVLMLTQIPYSFAIQHAPPGMVFGGQIAMSPDTNMYFSYIRQAAAGHVFFRNDLTYLDHRPVFFNPQWLAVGWVMRLLNLSGPDTYQVWRWAGGFIMLFGFLALACTVVRDRYQRIIALLMVSFGSGFSWFLYLAAKAGLLDIGPRGNLPTRALDLIWGVHPISHIMKNPHFSLPHGLFLFIFAFYFIGERTGKLRWYCAATGMALLEGLSRPYDLITLFGIVPVFVVVESLIQRRIDIRLSIYRLLPLIVCAPALLYFVYLFAVHPIFKFWASQGSMPAAPIGWHIAAFGLAFVLAVVRLIRYRSFPLTMSSERLMVIWIVVLFGLFHAYKFLSFMPYTPQLGVPFLAPMVLLAVPMFRIPRPLQLDSRNLIPLGVAAAIVIVNALGTPLLLVRATREGVSNSENWIRAADWQAFRWLAGQADESDVVLTDLETGNRMAACVTARIVPSHWSVTPHAFELQEQVTSLFSGRDAPDKALSFLQEIRPRWIYVPIQDSTQDVATLARIPGLHEEYVSSQVVIFSYTPT